MAKKKKKTSKKKTSKKTATRKQVKKKAAKATSKKTTAKKKTARKAAVKKSSKKKTTRARGGGKATAASMLKQPVTLTYDQIAARAFEVWERKGKPDGQDMANWREAEAELLAEAEA